MCFLSYPFQVREKEAAEGTSVYSYYDVMTCLVDSPQHSVGMLFMNQMLKKQTNNYCCGKRYAVIGKLIKLHNLSCFTPYVYTLLTGKHWKKFFWVIKHTHRCGRWG